MHVFLFFVCVSQAFTRHINSVLKGDKDLPFLPMDAKSRDLYKVGTDERRTETWMKWG